MLLTDITALNDKKLSEAISTAHRSFTIYKARFILMIAEFHTRKLAKKRGAPNTQTWLMRTHGVAERTAYEYLNVGNRLGAFPLIVQAFLQGDLSYSKVRLLLRYLAVENEEDLLDLALKYCLSELEQALAGRRKTSKRKSRNQFRLVEDKETGGVKFWGSLDPERGAELQASLKIAELATLRNIADIDPELLSSPESLDQLIDEAQAATPIADPEPAQAVTRFGTPMVGGMLSAFLGMINVVRSQPRSKVRAPGAQVNVLMTLDERVYIPGRHGGETGDFIRSVLNSEVCYHLLDKDGLHLKLTRSARTVSSSQETALLALWSYRCANPGCSHTRFLQFHHIQEWSEGGETNLDNLIPLCSACHALVTSGNVVIFVDEFIPGFLRFRMPGGESYTSSRRNLPIKNEEMGEYRDSYISGAVPPGDEDMLQIWNHEDNFADPAEEAVIDKDQL